MKKSDIEHMVSIMHGFSTCHKFYKLQNHINTLAHVCHMSSSIINCLNLTYDMYLNSNEKCQGFLVFNHAMYTVSFLVLGKNISMENPYSWGSFRGFLGLLEPSATQNCS